MFRSRPYTAAASSPSVLNRSRSFSKTFSVRTPRDPLIRTMSPCPMISASIFPASSESIAKAVSFKPAAFGSANHLRREPANADKHIDAARRDLYTRFAMNFRGLASEFEHFAGNNDLSVRRR